MPASPQVTGFPGSTASGVFILAAAQDGQQPTPKSPPGMGSFTPAASQLRAGSGRRVEAGSSASDRCSVVACCCPCLPSLAPLYLRSLLWDKSKLV